MRRQEAVTHAVGQTIFPKYETLDRLALFAEPHLSMNLHLHGLGHWNHDDVKIRAHARKDLQSTLVEKFGFSRVEIIRGARSVSKYVSKYCVKTDGYYEIW